MAPIISPKGIYNSLVIVFYKILFSLAIIFLTVSSALGKAEYDKFGRLTKINGKIKSSCPSQNSRTGVLLAIGQSNSANHAEKKVVTRFPTQVYNYYDGKCYVASSPLLGASGEEGEFITLLADRLIEKRIYDTVVIVSSGISGTLISRWEAGGDLNQMLLNTLKPIRKYRFTDVIWHQGESDFKNGTSSIEYQKSFLSLKNSLRAADVKAPFFIAVATRCGDSQSSKNLTALAQQELIDNKEIFMAVNTDVLLKNSDRRDFCHFNEAGQYKTANAYAKAIEIYRRQY